MWRPRAGPTPKKLKYPLSPVKPQQEGCLIWGQAWGSGAGRRPPQRTSGFWDSTRREQNKSPSKNASGTSTGDCHKELCTREPDWGCTPQGSRGAGYLKATLHLARCRCAQLTLSSPHHCHPGWWLDWWDYRWGWWASSRGRWASK